MNDDTVAWHENDGSQSFAERVITTLADAALAVFAIDLDGDGDVDALSASTNDDTVAWYENDCGTLAPTTTPTPPSAAPSIAPSNFLRIDGHCAGYGYYERVCPSSDATCGGWGWHDNIVGQGGAGDGLAACFARCEDDGCGGVYFDVAHGCGLYDACVPSGDATARAAPRRRPRPRTSSPRSSSRTPTAASTPRSTTSTSSSRAATRP